jgi:phospholipid transport system substrate-binding protein
MDLLINNSQKANYWYRGALMEISVKQKVMACITSLWCVILVLLVLGHNVNADEKYSNDANKPPEAKTDSAALDANDTNELWWSRWDAFVKDPNDPNELLKAKWDAIITVIQNKELDGELKKRIIDKIMKPVFDTELMAKLVLGRTHWPKLTAPQQKRFTELFAERLKNFYLEKTTLYNNEKTLFKPAIREKNSIHIPMVLISDAKEDSILYKLHKMDETGGSKMKEYWKIYDVEIEGISILLTYRSQFDDILRRGSVKDLFDQLEKPPAQ